MIPRHRSWNTWIKQAPQDVFDQFHKHLNNQWMIVNYGWINFNDARWKLTAMNNTTLQNLNVYSDWQRSVDGRESDEPYADFRCVDRDIQHWKDHHTWRVPPMVIDVAAFPGSPPEAEFIGPYQLIEGHNRLGYLRSLVRAGMMPRQEHDVYLLTSRAL